MINTLIYFVCSVVGLCVVYKPARWYMCSFFLPYLYDNRKLATFLGIKFEEDISWHTNRADTKIYIPGIFGFLFSKFTGLEIVSNPATIKEILSEQGAHAKSISMSSYLDELNGKKLSMAEFEEYLSNCILTETNKCFNILDKDKEAEFRKHLKVVRSIISGLTSDPNNSIKTIFREFSSVRKLIGIIHELTPGKRLILLIPHLSLIDGFSKMIIKGNGNLENLKMSDFFDFTSRFFVFINKGDLTFVTRNADDTNNANNRAFGLPKCDDLTKQKVFCPGNIFVTRFIESILSMLRTVSIKIEGNATITNSRFRNIVGKENIYLTFNKNSTNYEEPVYEDNTN